jgi:L-fuconolactonase
VQADSSEDETFFLISLAEQSEFIKGIVGWVDLQSKNIESQLTYFSQFEKIVGFRHVVQSETDPNFLARPDFLKGVQLLDTFDFAYDLLIYPNQLNAGIEFCKNNANQRIVLDHLAKPPIKSGDIAEWKKNIEKFKELENVSAKISGLITEAEWFNYNEKDILNIIILNFLAYFLGYEWKWFKRVKKKLFKAKKMLIRILQMKLRYLRNSLKCR